MKFTNKKGGPVNIEVEKIVPNPDQPRKQFQLRELDELCESIREFGIIQPLIVKKTEKDTYILIAGERRLRAAIRMGFSTVPVIIREATDQEAALIAVIENVQREDLSFLEEAKAYKKLINEHGLTQTEVARKVGKRQSTISNKLRILSLPQDVQDILIENHLTERHARALLKIEDDELRRTVINRIVKNGLNVTQSEKLISDILEKQNRTNVAKQRISLINYKLYINTIRKAFACVNEAEKEAKFFQEEKDDFVELRILIPKKRSASSAGSGAGSVSVKPAL